MYWSEYTQTHAVSDMNTHTHTHLDSDIALCDLSHVKPYRWDHVLVELTTLCVLMYTTAT